MKNLKMIAKKALVYYAVNMAYTYKAYYKEGTTHIVFA